MGFKNDIKLVVDDNPIDLEAGVMEIECRRGNEVDIAYIRQLDEDEILYQQWEMVRQRLVNLRRHIEQQILNVDVLILHMDDVVEPGILPIANAEKPEEEVEEEAEGEEEDTMEVADEPEVLEEPAGSDVRDADAGANVE